MATCLTETSRPRITEAWIAVDIDVSSCRYQNFYNMFEKVRAKKHIQIKSNIFEDSNTKQEAFFGPPCNPGMWLSSLARASFWRARRGYDVLPSEPQCTMPHVYDVIMAQLTETQTKTQPNSNKPTCRLVWKITMLKVRSDSDLFSSIFGLLRLAAISHLKWFIRFSFSKGYILWLIEYSAIPVQKPLLDASMAYRMGEMLRLRHIEIWWSTLKALARMDGWWLRTMASSLANPDHAATGFAFHCTKNHQQHRTPNQHHYTRQWAKGPLL